MPPCDKIEGRKPPAKKRVSILVLVDAALRPSPHRRRSGGAVLVSILVLVDAALRPREVSHPPRADRCVSILVLVDAALRLSERACDASMCFGFQSLF